ncbi:hypothetical protein BY458DRAFT_567613 [Sporodiniella umbellata]|nr:hypothetical protein BY458DRAFT_567613 [Sporodiniella umbellata]
MPVVSLSSHSAHLMARANVCTSQACQTAAKMIMNDMDLNVNPCDDFYQYSCVGTFTDAHNRNLDSLQTLLQGNYQDLLSGHIDPSFLDSKERVQDEKNFGKLKQFYNACMDQSAIDALGPTPIFPYINRVFTSLGYSPQQEEQRLGPEHVRVLTDTVIEMTGQGVSNLVSFYVGADDRQPNQYAISINQPDLTLPSREYYKQPETMSAYREGLVTLMTAVMGHGNQPELLAISNNVEAMVDRFVEFETHLASITLPIEELQDPNAVYNPMSLEELHQRYPWMDWFRALRNFAPNDVALPEKVIVSAPGYLDALSSWLMESKTRPDGASTEAIREFFTVKVVLANMRNVDQETRAIYRHTIGKITSGATEPQPRGRECVASTSRAFGQLLGRYFVMKSFGGEPERQQVSQFIDQILSSWTTRLDKVTWLDTETKARAVEKVKKIGHQEAYSIVSPDDRSPSSLQAYYADIAVSEKDHFGNQMSVYQSDFRKEWSQVGQPMNKDEWFMTPHEVNAYYTPNFNKIVIPAGILQTPFYNTEVPSYLNYGGIGAVIGHEITHAFDNSGRLYDGEGFLNSWWTETTSAAFNEKSQCFIQQYGNFSVQGPEGTSYPVSGKMTLGENLADNGGLQAAYDAMGKEDMLLPGLEKFTPEQLFFVNYGRVWCSNMRPEMAIQRVRTDVHSPARVRVNAAVQNSLEFSKAFQCKESQAMHPANKCQIW